jgi:GT2 family glycosyltransferase
LRDISSHLGLDEIVSIIIATYNGKKYLDKCLDSLKNTKYSNFEILVIDNNSTDGSAALVKQNYPYVKLIELKENLGFAASNNLAAREAKGNFYIFLNNDTIVTSTWLSELVRSLTDLKNSQVAIAQSFLLRPDGQVDSSGDFIDRFGRSYSSVLKNPSNNREILSARAACMIVTKEVFWKLGGFEEDFFASFEDVHLGWKAWIAGYKVVLASNSIVYHFAGQTVKRLKSTINFHSMKNQTCVILLNFEFPLGIKHLLLLFLSYLPIINLRRKDQEGTANKDDKDDTGIKEEYSNPILLKDVFKTFFWICRHALTLYKKYRSINRMRVRSTFDLVKIGLITENMHEK